MMTTKPTFFVVLLGTFALGALALFAFPQKLNALECSWTEYEYRCTEGYSSSQYVCTWYDPPPQTYCEPSTKTETQCGWEVQCDADDTNCKMKYVCKQVQVPSENCTTTDPPPYKSCEWDWVWVSGSCGNYPTVKQQTCPANSETSCSYATECSTSGSKTVTSYSCGSSGCVANTPTATCTRTFDTCTNNVGETGYVCGGSCTAPPNKTLTISVTANPSSGKAPLKNVQIDASVGGTATGTITYKLDCTNDLVYDSTETSSSTSYTFTKKCDYDTAGTYTAKVNVTRQTLGTSNTASVDVTAACDSTSFTACSTAKDFGSGGSIGAMCGADQYYQATVPAGKTCDVLFSVTPDSTADYDLYVENTVAACPSTSAWDCKSTNGTGANDQCTTNLGPGTYKALVHKYSGTGSYTIISTVSNCKTVSLTFPSTTWQRLWYNDPRVNNFSDSSFLGETPNESSLRFDTNWSDKVIYTKTDGTPIKDMIGFKSGRSITVNQSGTYQFIIGSDDGASLYLVQPNLVDKSLIIDQWAIGGWRTKTGTVFLTAGTHNLEFRYFENTGDARALFSPALSIAVEPASIVQGTQLTLTAYCAGSVCEGKTVFWDHSSSGTKPGTCVLSGGTCQTTFTTTGIGAGTVNFWATTDISNDGDTTDAGERSTDVPVNISSCAKNYDLIQDSTTVTVPTAGGTKQCTVNINSSGQDLSDSSNVKYYSIPSGNTRTVEMDDDPIGAGDCDLDLKWTTFFDDPLQGKLDVESRAVEKEALQGTWPFQTPRDLSFQYNLSSSECVFTGFSPGTANDDDGSSGENAWTNPTISTDKRAVVKKHGVKANYSSNETDKQVFSNRQFTLKECVSSDQCNPSSLNPNSDANSSKAYCNVDADNNGIGDITSNFSPNTCIDSVPPTSSIQSEANFIIAGSTRKLTPRSQDGTYWLKNDTYTIPVTDTDGNDSTRSGLWNCDYFIDDLGRPGVERSGSRVCGESLTVTVGPTGDCRTEKLGNCSIQIGSRDRANNLSQRIYKFFNVDYTAPSAE